jgi:hypothetical protein
MWYSRTEPAILTNLVVKRVTHIIYVCLFPLVTNRCKKATHMDPVYLFLLGVSLGQLL